MAVGSSPISILSTQFSGSSAFAVDSPARPALYLVAGWTKRAEPRQRSTGRPAAEAPPMSCFTESASRRSGGVARKERGGLKGTNERDAQCLRGFAARYPKPPSLLHLKRTGTCGSFCLTQARDRLGIEVEDYARTERQQELYRNQPAPQSRSRRNAQGRRHHGRDER